MPQAQAKKPWALSSSVKLHIALNPFSWVFWILDFALFLVFSLGGLIWIGQLIRTVWPSCCSCLRSYELDDDDEDEETGGLGPGHARRRVHVEELEAGHDGLRTVHEIMERAFEEFAEDDCAGTRRYLGMHPAKPFPVKKFAETNWKTYEEVWDRAMAFGAALRRFGLEPLEADAQGYETARSKSTLLIFEDTCEEWTTALLGCASQSIVVATSYATLGIESVRDSVQECQAAAILCNHKTVDKVLKEVCAKCPSVQVVITSPLYCTEEELAKPLPSGGRVKVMTFEEAVSQGLVDGEPAFAPAVPQPETPAVLMYTSGSTGKPKGVVLTNDNLASAIGAIGECFANVGLSGHGNCHIAYLPAAHIFELVSEIANLSLGNKLGYADPRSLASTGAVRQRPDGTINDQAGWPYPPGAIQEFEPTLLIAVPKIWDTFKKSLENLLGSRPGVGGAIVRWLVDTAYASRLWALRQHRWGPLSYLIFKLLVNKKMFKGKLKICVSGGGPLAADVHEFLQAGFCVRVGQGYGLTETSAASCVQVYGDTRTGVVGAPSVKTDIKLVAVADIKDRSGKPYDPFDTAHLGSRCLGRGEVVMRGPMVSAGYFKQPDKTAEVYKDGWFHSGDVGVWLPDGSLQIVDRVKNLVKLIGGEYIAIEAMEIAYSTSPYVDAVKGGVMCYGDGTMDRPVILVQANAQKIATALNLPKDTDPVEVCQSDAANKLVLASLHEAHAKGKLGANEKVVACLLIPGVLGHATLTPEAAWTPENGGLTASNKLNRGPIKEGLDAVMQPLMAKGRK